MGINKRSRCRPKTQLLEMNNHIQGCMNNDGDWAGNGKPAAKESRIVPSGKLRQPRAGSASCWKGFGFAEFQHSGNFYQHQYYQFQSQCNPFGGKHLGKNKFLYLRVLDINLFTKYLMKSQCFVRMFIFYKHVTQALLLCDIWQIT